MSDPAETAAPETDDTDAEVETVIAAFDGETRAAIRALIVANGFLMDEPERSRSNNRSDTCDEQDELPA